MKLTFTINEYSITLSGTEEIGMDLSSRRDLSMMDGDFVRYMIEENPRLGRLNAERNGKRYDAVTVKIER